MSEVQFPEKLAPLFEPYRYKVAYGGRAGMKSWGFARALLLLGTTRKLVILCTREVQNSIQESVHRLLSNQTQLLGLGGFYDVQKTTLKGYNGTEFLYAGLSALTDESVKSYEGVDIVWCEEAQGILKRSWNILIPTIRKPGSEIWISLNPELDTDETYTRFVEGDPPRTVKIAIGYEDNPWKSRELIEEHDHAKATMLTEDYENIWLGKPRTAVAGAIYAEEMRAMVDAKRITTVDYDPELKVHVIVDLGWNDSMFILLVQKHLSSLRVVDMIEDNHKTLDWYSAQLRLKLYNWGTMYLPHDAKHVTINSDGKSAKSIMEKLGWECEDTPDVPVENGIRQLRMAMRNVYIDKLRCARFIECLKRYKRGIPKSTGEPGTPVHDEYSHGADAGRYMGLVADMMTNEEYGKKKLVYPNARNA